MAMYVRVTPTSGGKPTDAMTHIVKFKLFFAVNS